jgi:hypothetical protein
MITPAVPSLPRTSTQKPRRPSGRRRAWIQAMHAEGEAAQKQGDPAEPAQRPLP